LIFSKISQAKSKGLQVAGLQVCRSASHRSQVAGHKS
jgi:hypothetical protein